MKIGKATWRTSTSGKTLWLCLLSQLICIASGSLVGSAAFASSVAWRGGWSCAVSLYPTFVLFSVFITLPFGGVAGLVAGIGVSTLGFHCLRNAVLSRWLRVGAAAGLLLGMSCPGVVLAMGHLVSSRADAMFYLAAGGLSGLVAGIGIAALGWREFGTSAPTCP